MQRTKYILTIIFGAILIAAGINHFLHPSAYFPFIPDFLPDALTNYLGGAAELILGISLFLPRYRSVAGLGTFWLMIIFLPLHVIDALRDHPVIGSKTIAYIRLPLQFVLIAWTWWISKPDNIKPI